MTDDPIVGNAVRIKELTESPPLIQTKGAKWRNRVRNVSLGVAYVALALGLWTQSEQNTATRQSQVNTCIESNRVRAQVADLWQYLIDENRKANPHPTPKQRADLAAFEQRVAQTYAPRKC